MYKIRTKFVIYQKKKRPLIEFKNENTKHFYYVLFCYVLRVKTLYQFWLSNKDNHFKALYHYNLPYTINAETLLS